MNVSDSTTWSELVGRTFIDCHYPIKTMNNFLNDK